MDLSVVVPLYNEEDSVTPLYQAIATVLDALSCEAEMIFVDDGSRDRTFAVAEELAAGDKRLRVVKFRSNYGQTPAMAAGIDTACGRIVITMDGDLQNDPQDIPSFIEKIDEGYDIVVGWRFDRQDKLISRKIPSRIANWLIGKVTGVPIKDNGCSLKAFRADVIKQVPLYSEMHRFIPAMASIAGPRIAEIKVRHHARQFGQSKYGLSRVYKVLLDLLTIKTIAPAHLLEHDAELDVAEARTAVLLGDVETLQAHLLAHLLPDTGVVAVVGLHLLSDRRLGALGLHERTDGGAELFLFLGECEVHERESGPVAVGVQI
jgi:glycosyltransferase involved in cell wall biosynthesis